METIKATKIEKKISKLNLIVFYYILSAIFFYIFRFLFAFYMQTISLISQIENEKGEKERIFK
jgi:hypothetical protein